MHQQSSCSTRYEGVNNGQELECARAFIFYVFENLILHVQAEKYNIPSFKVYM